MSGDVLDLVVVGAGPTGLAIGAAARKAGLDAVLVEKGSLANSIREFPTDMEFFTTRDKLEIAGVSFTIPGTKPTRREALAYYRAVAEQWQLPVVLREQVLGAEREADGVWTVSSRRREGIAVTRRSRAVALATGYWDQPRRLGVPGDELPWVSARYREPWGHVGETVVIVGAGNSACEAALDCWRHGVRVVMVHRGSEVKPTIKYWLKPDIENRIDEGSIEALFETEVQGFVEGGVLVRGAAGERLIACDAAYILIGYTIDTELLRRCGVALDPDTLVPEHDPSTGETNQAGLYVAGTLRAGRATDRIFIENSRAHGEQIIGHLVSQRGG